MTFQEKARELAAQLTLKEKATLCCGKDFWHTAEIARLDIPSIEVADGPHGLRKHSGGADEAGLNPSVPATCFPTAVSSACSWNRALMMEIGAAIGEECALEKVDILLGPGVNIKRSPLCGRNFEYFSEDPYLSGEMAAAFVNGVQSKGVGTSLKHFAVNNQEKRRMTIDAQVDERALREIYLASFETVVKKSQPWSIMSSYNKINGEYASENKRLLREILKEEWGFRGIVVTDWGACNDRVKGVFSGQDLEMPSSGERNVLRIIEAVERGMLSEDLLDEAVERLLCVVLMSMERRKKEDKDITTMELEEKRARLFQKNHQLAEQAALESCVLLKNKDGILPIPNYKKIGVVGSFARKPRFQGSGSSRVNAHQVDLPLTVLEKYYPMLRFEPGYGEDLETMSADMLGKACLLAEESDVVVLFVGLPDRLEAEAVDREHLKLPESHQILIKKLSEKNENIVVVLMNGSAVEIPSEGKIKGILETYLGGQAVGSAIGKLLSGEENPSGKLAESFPKILEGNGAYRYFPGGEKTVEYRESIFVGYRYYEAAERSVRYPFGHGLSYTNFEYSDITVSKPRLTEEEELTVSVQIKNTGDREGAEILQMYVNDIESTVFRPIKELKGFEKVRLKPGEGKCVTFTLGKRAFAYYSPKESDWVIEPGIFRILIGASSADIRSMATVELLPKENSQMEHMGNAPKEYMDLKTASEGGTYKVSKESFEKILGRALPESKREIDEPIEMNTPIGDIQKNAVGKLFYKTIVSKARKSFKVQGEGNREREFFGFVNDMPIRNLHVLIGKMKDPKTPAYMVEVINKNDLWKGIRLLKKI